MQSQMQKVLVFPENLAPDKEVEVDLTMAESKPINENSELLFCRICTFPMVFRLQLQPCKHYICESCFEKFNQECKFCGFEISNVEVAENKFE